MSLLSSLGSTALRLTGLQGQAPWNLFSTTLRIGVTGLSRAGKTAFLTSAAANLLARTQPRSPWPRSAPAMCRVSTTRPTLARLAADPPRWPARTDAVSLLALTATRAQALLPRAASGWNSWTIPASGCSTCRCLRCRYARLVAATLRRLATPGLAASTAAFLGFTRACLARAPADEALAHAGARLYRDMLGNPARPGPGLPPARPPPDAGARPGTAMDGVLPARRDGRPGRPAGQPLRRLRRRGAPRPRLAAIRQRRPPGDPGRRADRAARRPGRVRRHCRRACGRLRRAALASSRGWRRSPRWRRCACRRASSPASPSPPPRPTTWPTASAATWPP